MNEGNDALKKAAFEEINGVVLLTVPEAAKLAHTSPPTVWRWIKESEISFTRLGKKVYIEEGCLVDFMLTPENELTRADMEDLSIDPGEIEDILACQIREREALKRGATKLSEVDPPPFGSFLSFHND